MSILSLSSSCKKDELSEDEKLTQHEQKIIENMNDFIPNELKSLYQDYFNSIHGEVNNDLYLDSIETALDELKNSIQLNFNLDDYKKALSNSLSSLESSGKGSLNSCLGLGYAKGVSIEGGGSGSVASVIAMGLQASGGGGIKIVYDFVNQDRQFYYYTFCGYGASFGVGAGAALKANLGFTGINELITGIRYRGNNSGLNSFEGQEIGNSFSIDPQVSVALGGGVGLGLGVGIGTSHEAVADFSVTDNLSFCPEYKVEIENGVKSHSLQVSGNVSAVFGTPDIGLYFSTNYTMTNSIGVKETYWKFSGDRKLAGLRMAAEILLTSVISGTASISVPIDLNASSIALLQSFIDFSNCPAEIPAIGTRPVKNIQSTSALSGGIIKDNRGARVISSGVCWSSSPNPTIDCYKSSDEMEIGSYATTLTGLNANTTYYVRAYATNSAGTAYGKQISFTTTDGGNQSGTVTDIDGNVYKTIQIGTQTWMNENLRVTRLNDNTPLQYITDIFDWVPYNESRYCYYNFNEAIYRSTYGALYNWIAVGTTKLCPVGWHVPDKIEWESLITNLGGVNIAGGKLKEVGFLHWLNPNLNANNESGFTALPGGTLNIYSSEFERLGSLGIWWSSTQAYPGRPWGYWMQYNSSEIFMNYFNTEKHGISVRCIKDN